MEGFICNCSTCQGAAVSLATYHRHLRLGSVHVPLEFEQATLTTALGSGEHVDHIDHIRHPSPAPALVSAAVNSASDRAFEKRLNQASDALLRLSKSITDSAAAISVIDHNDLVFVCPPSAAPDGDLPSPTTLDLILDPNASGNFAYLLHEELLGHLSTRLTQFDVLGDESLNSTRKVLWQRADTVRKELSDMRLKQWQSSVLRARKQQMYGDCKAIDTCEQWELLISKHDR